MGVAPETYVVKPGDTYTSIAALFGVNSSALYTLNNGAGLFAGQTITIPGVSMGGTQSASSPPPIIKPSQQPPGGGMTDTGTGGGPFIPPGPPPLPPKPSQQPAGGGTTDTGTGGGPFIPPVQPTRPANWPFPAPDPNRRPTGDPNNRYNELGRPDLYPPTPPYESGRFEYNPRNRPPAAERERQGHAQTGERPRFGGFQDPNWTPVGDPAEHGFFERLTLALTPGGEIIDNGRGIIPSFVLEKYQELGLPISNQDMLDMGFQLNENGWWEYKPNGYSTPPEGGGGWRGYGYSYPRSYGYGSQLSGGLVNWRGNTFG